MSLFKKATNTSAYARIGLMGFAGSGKSYTAADFAIGLVQLMQQRGVAGADRPIFMIDTEGGSDWVKPMIEGAGIEFFTAKTSAFSDLVTAIKEAQTSASVLIIDSITAFWIEFCETYKKVKERKRGLEFQDWAYLKTEWRQRFINPFLNAPVHMLMCGRAGYEYDHYKDDSGKRQIEKSGIKMKSEAETGFEPSLVILMERETDLETKKIAHVAHVLKDRRTDSKTLDGKIFRSPKFSDFMPHVEWLNLGGEQLAVDASRTSADIIQPDEKRDDDSIRRAIVVDEIDGLLDRHGLSGTSKEARMERSELVLRHFKTASRTEIEKLMPLHELRQGFNSMHMELEGEPSRYFPKDPELDDAIPDFTPKAKPAARAKPVPKPALAPVPAPKAPVEIVETLSEGASTWKRGQILADIQEAVETCQAHEDDAAGTIKAIDAVMKRHQRDFAKLTEGDQTAIKNERARIINRLIIPAGQAAE